MMICDNEEMLVDRGADDLMWRKLYIAKMDQYFLAALCLV